MFCCSRHFPSRRTLVSWSLGGGACCRVGRDSTCVYIYIYIYIDMYSRNSFCATEQSGQGHCWTPTLISCLISLVFWRAPAELCNATKVLAGTNPANQSESQLMRSWCMAHTLHRHFVCDVARAKSALLSHNWPKVERVRITAKAR